MSDAEIALNGRLTADPELRFTQNGLPVVGFTVAHTPRRRNVQTGEWEDSGETLFLACTAWRDHAQNISRSLHKGDAVNVVGRLKMRSFEHNGEQRKVVEVDADIVSLDLRYAAVDAVVRNASRSGAGAAAVAEGDAWATPAPATTRKSAAAA